jgi:hypothetical protein
MRKKILLLFTSVFLLFSFHSNISTAQIRKGGGGRKGSLYFSGGMNMEKYSPTTLHINQPSLGNNYDLTKVNADNKVKNNTISPTTLNYRIGYYFGFHQKYGIELNYDPINYHVTDGQSLQASGTINDMTNVTKTINFSSKTGYYYSLNGANLLLANFVRRFTLFRPNSNRIGIDAIAKAGAGPAMPNVQSSFPGNPGNGPKYQFGGWNAGIEGAIRVTFYRYVYLEFAAKYDYASLTGLNIYEGTAAQNINTLELIGSLGFTFPTHRFNPLFYKGRRIITILPLYTLKDHAGKSYGDTKRDRKNKEKEKEANGEITDVPEFSDIVDRKENLLREDSLAKGAKQDSLNKALHPSDTSIAPPVQDTPRHKKSRRNRRHRNTEDTVAKVADSTVGQLASPAGSGAIPVTNNTTSTPPPAGVQVPAPVPAPAPPLTNSVQQATMETPKDTAVTVNENARNTGGVQNKDTVEVSRKEKKRMEREAEKEKRAQEKAAQQLLDQQAQAEQNRIDSIGKAQAAIEKEKKQQAEKEQDDKAQALKDAEESKKQAIKDSIEKKKQDKEEEIARKAKALEDLKDQRKRDNTTRTV